MTTDIAATDVLTLCAACNVVVRLTPAQLVVVEAERIALDTVHLAFCRRCISEAASTG